MTDNSARAIRARRLAVLAGLAVTFLGGVIAVVPAVTAGTHIPPAVTAAPQGWPAAKAFHLRAEDRLRQEAAGRPLLPPPGDTPSVHRDRMVQRQADGGIEFQSDAASGAELGAGIVPLAAGGPFRPAQFLGTNLWNGPVRGQWEVVQAGGVPVDRALGAASPTRAAVYVYTRSPDPASAALPAVRGVITPPGGPAGKFTVTKVSGRILTLSLDGDGKTAYHFDTVTRSFIR